MMIIMMIMIKTNIYIYILNSVQKYKNKYIFIYFMHTYNIFIAINK